MLLNKLSILGYRQCLLSLQSHFNGRNPAKPLLYFDYDQLAPLGGSNRPYNSERAAREAVFPAKKGSSIFKNSEYIFGESLSTKA